LENNMQDAGWLRFHTTGTDDSDFKGAAENGVGRDGFVRRGLNPHPWHEAEE